MSVFALLILKCDKPGCGAECNAHGRLDGGGRPRHIEALEPGWSPPADIYAYDAPWFCPAHARRMRFTVERPAIVLAGNERVAGLWAQESGLPPRAYRFIDNADRLRGVTFDEDQVVRLAGHYDRSNAYEIGEAVRSALARSRQRVPHR